MALNINWVICPNCKGRYYVEAQAAALDTFRCHCPFCANQFQCQDAKEVKAAAKPAAQ